MCGRYVQFSLFPLLKQEFNLQEPGIDLRPSFNITPGSDVPVVVREDKKNRLVLCRWGLVPPWSKDPSIGSRMINARAETLEEKPTFKSPFRKHRCLIPADGFYEWKKGEKGKTPIYITMKKGGVFGFAGLFSDWNPPEGETIRTCSIITTQANSLISPVHERMPAIIRREERDFWLDPKHEDPGILKQLLIPFPPEEMDAWEVSKRVNVPGNDSPENIRKTAPGT